MERRSQAATVMVAVRFWKRLRMNACSPLPLSFKIYLPSSPPPSYPMLSASSLSLPRALAAECEHRQPASDLAYDRTTPLQPEGHRCPSACPSRAFPGLAGRYSSACTIDTCPVPPRCPATVVVHVLEAGDSIVCTLHHVDTSGYWLKALFHCDPRLVAVFSACYEFTPTLLATTTSSVCVQQSSVTQRSPLRRQLAFSIQSLYKL